MKQSLILKKKSTLEDALKMLDENSNGTLSIVDENLKLIGLITDGDVRRGILNRKTELVDFINKNPKTLKKGISLQQTIHFLKENHMRQVIIIDEENAIHDVIVLDDIEVTPRNNYIVIMAGGLGTRLGELTKEVPKPMLYVGGKPILQSIVESFKEFGFTNFIFCVNYKSQVIENFFGNGSAFGINIEYNQEDKRMGTAGPLSMLKQEFNEPFFVVNGDILTTLDYDNFLSAHVGQNAVATMCVKRYNHQIPYAQVNLNHENDILTLEEKPILNYYINAGLYILNKEALSFIPKNTFYDMPTLFEELLSRGKSVKAYRIDQDYWMDIGKTEDFQQANLDFRK